MFVVSVYLYVRVSSLYFTVFSHPIQLIYTTICTYRIAAAYVISVYRVVTRIHTEEQSNSKPQKGVLQKTYEILGARTAGMRISLMCKWDIYCVLLIVFRLGGCRPPGFNPPRGLRHVRLSVYAAHVQYAYTYVCVYIVYYMRSSSAWPPVIVSSWEMVRE